VWFFLYDAVDMGEVRVGPIQMITELLLARLVEIGEPQTDPALLARPGGWGIQVIEQGQGSRLSRWAWLMSSQAGENQISAIFVILSAPAATQLLHQRCLL
jgi:hypothetical protein